MTEKHTPGPWRWGYFSGQCRKASHAPGQHPGDRGADPCVYDYKFEPGLVDLYDGNDDLVVSVDTESLPVSKANALLISAAPDLLAALDPEFMVAVAAVLDANGLHATAGSVGNYANTQRDAIAKATRHAPD